MSGGQFPIPGASGDRGAPVRRRRSRADIACAASSVLLVLILVGWCRSQWAGEFLTWATRTTVRELYWESGTLTCRRARLSTPPGVVFIRVYHERGFQAWGEWGRFGWQRGADEMRLRCPFWALALAASVGPLTWVIRRRRLPRWARLMALVSLGLWPVTLMMLVPSYGVGDALPLCAAAAVLAVPAALLWRAAARVVGTRTEPWPWQVRARRAWRRRAAGRCVECGYDLRGSPHRCPECGRDTAALAGALT